LKHKTEYWFWLSGIQEVKNMLKIHSLTLAFVFIQATGHHAFIPNLKSNQFGSNTKSGVPVIQSFSTTLADSDRDVGTFRSENEAIVDVAEAKLEENEYFAKEITRQILSDRLDYGEKPEDDQLITLTTNNIISVLTYHSQQKSVDGAETIDKILGRLEEKIDVGENTYFKLHCGHYTIAVTAWSKSGHPDSAERATGIVNRMKERNIALNEVTYNAWMHAYMIKNNISMVEEIFQNMKETIPTKIRVQEWNILLLAHAKQGRPKEAEEIVKTMVRRYNSGTSEVLPDLISYSILLDAWSKSDEEGRGFRAETILDSIEERDISFDKTTYAESTASSPYVAAMRTIIHSGEDNIVERVESIYKRVLVQDVTPDAYIYATLLEAYASARSADASKKVSEVLAMMQEKLNDISIEDKTVVYNAALKLLKQSREPNSIDRAEELFMKMKAEGIADEFTYGTMLALYTNKDGNSIDSSSSQRTEELLNEITSEKGINKNTLHMNIAMNSLIKAGKIKEAVGMLEEMEEEYRNGNYFLQPNTVTYSNLMHGWIKSNDPQKSKQAVVVYDKMIAMFKSGNTEAKPNFVSYVTLVDSIVKSGEVGAAERAEKIVRDMYQSYKRGESNFKPNAQLVSTVIDCWSKSRDNNAGERAEMLLNWLIEIYEEEQDEALMPKAYPFTSCKWKLCRIPDTIEMNSMISSFLKPLFLPSPFCILMSFTV